MALSWVQIKQRPKQTGSVWLKVGLVLIVATIVSALLAKGWIHNTTKFHAVFDASTIFIGLAIFMVMWHNYERNTPVNRLVGLGFLPVAIFDLQHSLLYGVLYEGSYDLSHAFRLAARLSEALILLLLCSGRFKHQFKKWHGLVIAVAVTAGTTFCVYYFPLTFSDFPQTFWGLVLEYITVGCFFLSLYLLRQGNDKKDNPITYSYILMGLLLAIPSELAFVWFYKTYAFFEVFGHILKITYYYCLFKGIFVGAITFPYAKLEAASEYMESVLNNLPEGIVACDETPRVQFLNRQAKIYLGSHISEAASLLGISEGQQTLNLDKFTTSLSVDNIMTINDGWGNIAKLRVNNRNLATGGTLCIITDVKQEQELANLQLQTQTLLNAINNQVLMFDTQNCIILCNKALEDLCELDAKSILGMHLQEFRRLIQFCPKPQSHTLLTEDSEMTFEATLITPSGRKKEIIYSGAPILNVDKQCIGRIAVGADLTTIKKQQQKLQQQEKLIQLGQMAAGVVHEIRNPLTALKGFSQIILARSQDEQIKEFARIMEIEASEVNKVVSDFLAFAKPSPPVLREVWLSKLIADMKVLVESHCFTRDIHIQFDLTPTEEPVFADEGQLKQVIMNIINNAIEAVAATQQPRLQISTRQDPDSKEMVMIITDNGKGISEEDKAKIGTPFFTTKDKGTGLGLSICYQIMKEHNGKIEVESMPGRGCSFMLTLPWISQCQVNGATCLSA